MPTDEDESSDHALDELTELTHTYPVSLWRGHGLNSAASIHRS